MTGHIKTYIAGISLFLAALTSAIVMSPHVSAVVDNSPDCDDVAIIRCGAFSEGKLREKAKEGDVPKVFSAFGINQNELNGFVDGIVWRDGRVTVDGKTVATDAMTAGRNFGGSPIAGTNGAGKYPTSKFATEGQTAYVKMVDGKFTFAVIKACGNPVSATPKNPPVTPEQPQPAYECVSLGAEKLSRTKVKFTADAKASGGATIEKYEFGFGDGYGITVNESSYTYDYKQTGTFETNVVIHVKVNGNIKKVTSRACEKSVTIREENTPEPCPYDSSLPKNSPDCIPPKENCPIEGKGDLPKDSPECKEDEQPALPAAISKAGPEAILSGLFGSSALGYGTYSYWHSRRELIAKLLGRK